MEQYKFLVTSLCRKTASSNSRKMREFKKKTKGNYNVVVKEKSYVFTFIVNDDNSNHTFMGLNSFKGFFNFGIGRLL